MADSLMFQVGSDTKGFQDGIGGCLTAIAGLAAAFFGVQKVVESFSEAIDLGGRLHDLSTRTGETAGNLSILERAFQNTGLEAERVGPLINKMQKSIVDASDSGSIAAKAFNALGLSFSDLQGKQPIEQMEMIAHSLSGIEDPAQRAQLAIAIFGKSGGDLLPILRNFSEEIDQARSQLGSLPEIMTKSAAGFDSVGDSLHAIQQKSTELAVGFASTLLPAVEKVLESLSMMDAAGFGQGLSELLLGAFESPLKIIDLWANSMRFAAQTMGNELLSAIDFAGRLLDSTFGNESTWRAIGGMVEGSLLLGINAAGLAILEIIKPLQEIAQVFSPAIGLLNLGGDQFRQNMAEAEAQIVDSSKNLSLNLTEAAVQTAYVRKDYLGAQDSASRIAELTASIREDGRAFAESFDQSHQTSKEMLAEINAFEPIKLEPFPTIANDATGLPIPFPTIANDATGLPSLPVNIPSSGGGGGMSSAQIQATQAAQLALIAGASSTQAIGQSASAKRAQDLQKQLDTLNAQGKGGTAEARALQKSIQTNTDIAFGNVLTSADKDVAHQLAFDAWSKDTSQSMTALEDQFQTDILNQKRADDPTSGAAKSSAQTDKANQAAASASKTQPQDPVLTKMDEMLAIWRRIEPKLPQHIMV